MAFNLRNRSFLKLLDFTPREIEFFLDLAADLKRAKYTGTEQPRLKGKNIALIFEKTSTRTRCAFEVAALDQGAHVTYLGPTGSQIGVKESMKDTARVLGRMYDGIEYRGFAQATVEELAKYAGVPVWNGLTNEFHPTQILADFLTMREHAGKPLKDVSYAYLGDARFNMGNSLLVGGAKMGMDVRIVAPKALQPAAELIEECRRIAAGTGARITITDNGEGMSDEVKQRVFESFFTTKPVGQGTGLGMPIIRDIIEERHGGHVTFDSTEGVGTSFTLTIPVKK
jgi:ornithine carbamoyltransferase